MLLSLPIIFWIVGSYFLIVANSSDSITNHSEDTYDITVHNLDGVKEIRYYDKAAAHDPKFLLLGGGKFTTYYYRVKPDLSYERVSLEETRFDDGRN